MRVHVRGHIRMRGARRGPREAMPMAPSAFASGRGAADLVVAAAELTILA